MTNSVRNDEGVDTGQMMEPMVSSPTPTHYHTADSTGEGDSPVSSPVEDESLAPPPQEGLVSKEPPSPTEGNRIKRVQLMIKDFEARDSKMFEEKRHASSCLTLATTNTSSSSRTSVVSSQSSFEEEVTASSGSSEDNLTSRQRQEKKLHLCAREIMTTEKTFVDVLKLINVEFRGFVENTIRETGRDIIPLEDFRRIFRHLPQLMAFNQDLLNDFVDRVENWDENKKIADVIVKKGPFLKLYTDFIKDFEGLSLHLEQCYIKFPEFKKVVLDFESQPQCHHLRISHFLLKPVQRLPQYKLMLEEYMKHLDPDSVDFDDTTQALTIVSSAADHANTTVKKGVTKH